MNATIFGSGNMGTAIARVLEFGGASVAHLDSRDEVGTVTGDIVVLAVPYTALGDIVGKYADQFAGKTVVDITNPVNFKTFDSLVIPVGTSAAAELAAALPASHVIKAFNTTFAATLSAKTVGPNQTTVLIAGDNGDAKAALAAAITAGGVGALDAGSLCRAHELEAIGFMQLVLAASDKISWTGGFAVVG